MAHSTAITEIGKLVDEYVFVKQLPQDDYFVYLQMACNCYRIINTRHSNNVVTEKVAVDSLGIIEFPNDMNGFGGLYVPINGEFWGFTRKNRKVNTTTTTLGIEGQNSAMGEGVDVLDDVYYGLGGRGGNNSYYLTVDWKTRRIFCDGFKSDTAVLQYTSSGLVVSGNTYVPQICKGAITSYIDWQKEINNPRSLSIMQTLKDYYDSEIFQLRIVNFMPSKDEICDAWDKSSSQSVLR